MIIGAIIAGQLLQYLANKPTIPVETDINEKFKGMPDLEAKFKELSEGNNTDFSFIIIIT